MSYEAAGSAIDDFLFTFTVRTKFPNSCNSCPLNSFHGSQRVDFHLSEDVRFSQLIHAVTDWLVLCKGIYILGQAREQSDAGAEGKAAV